MDRADRSSVVKGVVIAVACAVMLLGYYLWRDRPAVARVRLVSASSDVARCQFVSDISTQLGNPNPSRVDAARGWSADLITTERNLRQQAAVAGADVVLVVSRGAVVHAKTYRCSGQK